MSVVDWSNKQLKQTRAWSKEKADAVQGWWRRRKDDVLHPVRQPEKRDQASAPRFRDRDLWPFLAGFLAGAGDDAPRRVAELPRETRKSFWQMMSRRRRRDAEFVAPLAFRMPQPAPKTGARTARRALAVTAGSTILLSAVAVENWQRAREAELKYPPNGRFISVGRVRLHYFEKGSGQDVVLLHGNFTCAEEMILSGVFDLLAQGHRVVAFDRPGFGYSSRIGPRNWTPERQARFLREGFRQLGLKRPIIVAHSFATLVALSLAVEFPDEIGGLVLMSGEYFPAPRLGHFLLAPTATPILGDFLRYTISPLVMRLTAPQMNNHLFAPQPVPKVFKDGFPLELALRPEQIHATAADAVLMIPAIMRLRRHYSEIDCPVVVMAGSEDHVVDAPRHAVRLSRALINSQLLVQPGQGHMLHFGAPHAVSDAAKSLLVRRDEVAPMPPLREREFRSQA